MKAKKFLTMAALTMGLAMTGALMTSCSKIDIPVADNDGNPPVPKGKTVKLDTLSTNYVAQDGDILTGTLAGSYTISIADGATVTLSGVITQPFENVGIPIAGITCHGNAIIVLADDTNNEINGQDEHQPGIQAGGMGFTLTIRGGENGTGKLIATGGDGAAGIGSGYEGKCGDIKIEGGSITAIGGRGAAGIGSGSDGSCGKITISSPATGEAQGGEGSPWDIGAGKGGTCDEISIEEKTISGSWYGADPIDSPNGGGGGDSPFGDPNGGVSPIK